MHEAARSPNFSADLGSFDEIGTRDKFALPQILQAGGSNKVN